MEALFIVRTPFQALCCCEAIHHYNLRQYSVIVLQNRVLQNNIQVPYILDRLNIIYTIVRIDNILQLIIWLCNNKKHKYSRIFIGDYYDPTQKHIAAFMSRKNYNVTYLDDGASTLTILSLKDRYAHLDFMTKFHMYISRRLMKIKRIDEKHFSIFDSNNKSFEKNNFVFVQSLLKMQTSSDQTYDAFVIGSVQYGFKNPHNYYTLLNETFKYCKKITSSIVYSPHRATLKDEIIKKICNENNVLYSISDFCVEMDYLIKGITPKLIIGFGSTALFTLKKIFPKARVVVIPYPDQMLDQENKKIYENVYEKMEVQGIERIEIL